MKRIILLVALAVFGQLSVSQVAFAQNNGNHNGKNRTPEERADMQIKRMTQDLTLTSDQVPKVKAIILDRAQKVDAIKAKYANATDKKAMHQEIKTLHEQKDAELKAVLTPDQYAKHLQMEEQQKQKMKEKKQNGNH